MTMRALTLSAAVVLAAGCATPTHTGRVAEPDGGCPMNFTLYCETSRPGPAHAPSSCRCMPHRAINEMLNRDY